MTIRSCSCGLSKGKVLVLVSFPSSSEFSWLSVIDPPRGVLLYGPPGTGKTMLAKAVANHTTAAFIRVVGSEFVQKYLGEFMLFVDYTLALEYTSQSLLVLKIELYIWCPTMVRDVFRLAKS
ncbi:26S proteasome regulatory subunit 6B [Tanacetum coccineum]